MPLYEYKCPNCGEQFEEIVTFSKADEVACDKCGFEKPERLMSTFATAVASAGSSIGPSCSSASSCGSSGFS